MEYKSRKRQSKRITGVIVLICLLIFTSMATAQAADNRTAEKIRVGFFYFDGYHIIDDQGHRSGYGYDFLQYLARYSDFTYEYTGYDKSWNEMQEMLENGEIDLLTSAQKTKERQQKFDFSDQPIGSSAAILTVKAGDTRYMYDDYRKLDGIRIGLLKGNSRNEDLERFSNENGFNYRPVYYDDINSLTQALQQGDKIDAIVTSNLRGIKNEWIIASFENTPFYIMVKKGNKALLEKVNEALDQLYKDNASIIEDLYDRYYTPDNGNEIAYTAEERKYIRNCQEKGIPIRVTVNSGREPVSYFVNEEASGIIPEIAKEVFRRTGLPYEFVPTSPTTDARELLREGEAQVRFDGTSDLYEAELYGLRVTDSYIELPVSYVTRKELERKPLSAAVIKNSDVVDEYVTERFDKDSIKYYDSAEECVEAVRMGKQDAAYFQTYIAQRFVNQDIKNQLKEQLVPGYSLSFAVSVAHEDPRLFSIVNKAVQSLRSDEVNQIILEQTSNMEREMSLIGFLYDNPVFWIILLAFTAGFVIFIILYLYRRKNLKLELEKVREFEKFITYVCRANDRVIEMEPESRICRFYQVVDGKICSQEVTQSQALLQIEGVHPEDENNVKELIGKDKIDWLIQTSGEIYFECRVEKKEKERYQWYSYTIQGVPEEMGSPGHLMIFIKNIDRAKREDEEKRQTLQDALTAAQQANESRGNFMSRMSHEIRTPLNAIIGYLNIAASNLDSREKAGECLKKSEFAAHQLLNIVNDVLDISAIESGKMKIAMEEFNLRQLLSGITSMFRTQAEEKGVKFSVYLKDLTEENLIGDQFRVNQILLNLLSNAVKFTLPGGQVKFTILQKGVVEQNVYVQFLIDDTGIGMSESYKKHMFLPFEQQDASTARKFGGTGLGLSITKNLVSMMNGSMDVQSQEGEGTCFKVNLSFGIADTRKNLHEPYNFSSLRVLVLYDPNSDYESIKTMLNRVNVKYDLVLNIEEAVRKVAQKKEEGGYGLYLIDWDIPEAEAVMAAEKIRAAAGPGHPVVEAVSYEAGSPEVREGLIDGVIMKPVFQSALFDVLAGVCSKPSDDHIKIQEAVDFGIKGIRILLAEDNELNAEIAKEMLGEYGLSVEEAVNGMEAVEKFKQSVAGSYQAILMDIQMPVMNGYEAAKRIRSSSHPQAESIPIIALTADAFVEDINHALAAGMNAHVSKPIDFVRLCNILAQFINGKKEIDI